jgi:hypothetical protein
LFGFRERERNGNQEREREKEKKWKIVLLSSLFRLSRFTIEKSTRYADVTVLALRLLGV